jgi:hypothetical protein
VAPHATMLPSGLLSLFNVAVRLAIRPSFRPSVRPPSYTRQLGYYVNCPRSSSFNEITESNDRFSRTPLIRGSTPLAPCGLPVARRARRTCVDWPLPGVEISPLLSGSGSHVTVAVAVVAFARSNEPDLSANMTRPDGGRGRCRHVPWILGMPRPPGGT